MKITEASAFRLMSLIKSTDHWFRPTDVVVRRELLVVFLRTVSGNHAVPLAAGRTGDRGMRRTKSRLLHFIRRPWPGKRSRWMQMWLAFVALVSAGGCMTAQNTRFPTWQAWFPSAENEAYERQDPFPDPDLGPSLDSTPRGYERPRSQARRAAEQRLLQGVPVGPENVSPGVPQGGLNSGRAVY